MSDVLLVILLLGVAAIVVMQVMLLRRKVAVDPDALRGGFDALAAGQERTERGVREEIARGREEAAGGAKDLREEVSNQVKGFNDSVLRQMADIAVLQKQQLKSFVLALAGMSESSGARLEAMRLTIEDRLAKLSDDSGRRLDAARIESAGQSNQMRENTTNALKNFNDSILKSVTDMANGQRGQFDSFKTELSKLTESNEKKLAELRETVESKLTEMQAQNATKLDEMRQTVDEKLQGTLEKRLGESFKLVSERLEQVHKGLGEMQTLAGGVGDLKRMLVNVKTRGTWGEMQLGNLLEQVLSPDQYAANVATRKDSNDRVEFAIRLPGREDNEGDVVWLPIDAKFPREDYERLVEASEKSNPVAVEEAAKALEMRIRAQAKVIREKYIDPPATTDFAILFLPIEGLYAEVLRRAGLVESLQRDCRVSIAGPTTLAALLNSLQMGFRTLAIQKRSSEVWNVLSEVKTQFGKFGEVLDKVKTKLTEASNTIDKVQVRTRVINRKLRDVQELPVSGPGSLLESPPVEGEKAEEEGDKVGEVVT